ncbi:MAG TPA: hypothetical protein VEU30_12670 [Thermoanaerobaculia bacterium]|nr:hypothetical protein [Thermoanaerobaculia bacterium]
MAIVRQAASGAVEKIAEALDEIETLLARLLDTPRGRWWRLIRTAEYRQPEVVRRLLALADDAGLRDRKLSVALVRAATSIADALARDNPRAADLRFQAWKLASALFREAGRYDDTVYALEFAEEAARNASDSELALAAVRFSRALLCAEPDVWKPDEATTLLDRAEEVFARRDPGRRGGVVTARAFLSFRAADFDSARACFEEILAATPEGDRDAYLNALSNLMFARVELGQMDDDVRRAIDRLVEENLRRGRSVQVARARWLQGKVARFRGNYVDAIALLRAARSGIADSDAAIRIGMDILESLLLDERHDDAASLALELSAEAVALDQREPSRRRSLTAEVFAYARQAAHRGALTADLVSELSRYVDRIHRQRPTDFIPPMPLEHM